MSKRRILTLYHKDLTLFFKGRRKIRQKAEILYFLTLFVISFLLGILYRRVKIQTGAFALTFTFFLYLLMSFIFELKHFIFLDEDRKIIKRLPVLDKEYYTSKSLLILTFGIIFTTIILLGHFVGAYILAHIVIPIHKMAFCLLFNSFFSIAFSMFIYALLLIIFKSSTNGDVVSKVQIALGILFGLIFAFAPNLSPILDAIDRGNLDGHFWFTILPFTQFVKASWHFSIKSILIATLYIIFPLYFAVLLGFDEKEVNMQDNVRSFDRFIFVRDRKKRSIHLLVLTHITRSKITKRTLIAPTVINMVVLFMWIFSKNAQSIVFFGVWTLVFMSVISYLALSISDSYKAFWMLKKAPMIDKDVIANGINAGFLYIVLPYGFFVFLVFLLKGISIAMAPLPILYGLVLCYFFMQLLFIVRPCMLFSRAGFERGISSIKELVVSFILVPTAAGLFNFLYKLESHTFLKIAIGAFLIIDIFLNKIVKYNGGGGGNRTRVRLPGS